MTFKDYPCSWNGNYAISDTTTFSCIGIPSAYEVAYYVTSETAGNWVFYWGGNGVSSQTLCYNMANGNGVCIVSAACNCTKNKPCYTTDYPINGVPCCAPQVDFSLNNKDVGQIKQISLTLVGTLFPKKNSTPLPPILYKNLFFYFFFFCPLLFSGKHCTDRYWETSHFKRNIFNL